MSKGRINENNTIKGLKWKICDINNIDKSKEKRL